MIESLTKKNADKFLNELYESCFDKNFGMLSKRDFEIRLFHYYHQSLKENSHGKFYDSDFEIGKRLGLTITRVRNLKEQEELRYPRDLNWWKEEFKTCVKTASFDEKTQLVKFNVPDVNLIKEIRNYFDMKGVYNEYQLNPSLFQCRLDVLFQICLELLKEDVTQDAVTELETLFKNHANSEIAAHYDAQRHPFKVLVKSLSAEAFKSILGELPSKVANSAFDNLCTLLKESNFNLWRVTDPVKTNT